MSLEEALGWTRDDPDTSIEIGHCIGSAWPEKTLQLVFQEDHFIVSLPGMQNDAIVLAWQQICHDNWPLHKMMSLHD